MSAAWGRLGAFRGVHHYDPNQPRVPKGNPDGGQWTRVGSRAWTRLAANEPEWLSDTPPSIGHNRPPADTPREPPRGSTNPPLRRSQTTDRVRGGGAWLGELFKGLQDLLEGYAAEHAHVDLFGYKKGLEEGTISAGRVDGRPFIGVNSKFGVTYTTADRLAAIRLRDEMSRKYDQVQRQGNKGYKPNDVFFHAETTLLLRAARAFGGSLQGRTVFIYSNRPMCSGCGTLLPLIGAELGNPTVVFSDYEGGNLNIMRDGKWVYKWSAK
jgi:hypothetical protein